MTDAEAMYFYLVAKRKVTAILTQVNNLNRQELKERGC